MKNIEGQHTITENANSSQWGRAAKLARHWIIKILHYSQSHKRLKGSYYSRRYSPTLRKEYVLRHFALCTLFLNRTIIVGNQKLALSMTWIRISIEGHEKRLDRMAKNQKNQVSRCACFCETRLNRTFCKSFKNWLCLAILARNNRH